jgi:hypothetical protein
MWLFGAKFHEIDLFLAKINKIWSVCPAHVNEGHGSKVMTFWISYVSLHIRK